MELKPGAKLGPYEILSPIGEGGMGQVWKARDTRLERTVAVKVMPEYLADREDLRARFEREARTVSSLNHPNICVLYDIGKQDGAGFMVLEYLEGETLAACIARGPMPLGQALKYATQIADALDRAHRSGVSHRDVKPANIMLTRDGVKVLDFGLAKTAPKTAGPDDATLTAALTGEGTVLGTPQYMAPEQYEGKEADARSDIFAFGCVTYEMVTGKRCFDGKTKASVIAAVLGADPPPMSAAQPLAPPALERLVKRCLEKDPEDRYQSMRDVVLDLRAVRVDGTGGVRAEVSVRPTLAWIVAGVLAALAAGLAFVHFRETPPAGPVSLGIVLPPGQSIEVSDMAPLAISADGKRVVYTGSGPNGAQLYVRELSSFRMTSIPGTQGAVNPFFSPDGQWVAFTAAGLRKVALTGGAVQSIGDIPLAGGGDWGLDGTIYGAPSMISLVYRVQGAGGAPQEAIAREETEEGDLWPQLLPGGKALLLTKWSGTSSFDDAVIEAVDLSSRKRRVLITGGSGARFVPPNLLVYAHAGSLMAVHFNPRSLDVKSPPIRALGDLITMPASGAPQFAVSETGTLVYLSGSAVVLGNSLDWISGGLKDPQPFGMRPGLYQSPRFSPDGSKIALTVRLPHPEIWIYDVRRGTMQQMTFAPGENEIPVWSPDGTQIAYAGNGRKQAYAFPVDGSRPEHAIGTLPNHFHLQSWSPDGSLIALETQGGIWMLPATGAREAYPYLDGAGEPKFSPDGRWLAYIALGRRSNVYIQRFPGPGEKIQVSSEGGFEPVWSRDGRELYYKSAHTLFRVSVATTPALLVGKPEAVYQGHFWESDIAGPNYDVAPDGKRLLMLDNDKEPEVSQIHVVLNWAAQFGN